MFSVFLVSVTGEASQNGSSAHGPQNGGPKAPHSTVNAAMPIVPISTVGAATAVPGPTTNLHIGMDYWGTPASSTIPAMRGKVPSTPVAGGTVTPASRDSVQPQLWLQVHSLSLKKILKFEISLESISLLLAVVDLCQ